MVLPRRPLRLRTNRLILLFFLILLFSLSYSVLQLKALSRSTSFTQPILLLDTPPTFRKDNQQNISTKKNTALYYFESKIKEPEATESLDVWWIVKWINKKLFRYDKCDYLSSRIQEHNGTANPKILIVDRGDSASFHKSNCAERIALLVGSQNLYLTMRNLVNNRNFGCMSILQPTCFDENTNFTLHMGKPWDYSSLEFTKHIHNGCIAKVDFPVREALLSSIENRLGNNDIDTLRSKGVAHFWNVEHDRYGQLRNRVTVTIANLITNSNITGTAGLVSTRGKTGRTRVSEEYTNALLEHTIVVVCQRDHWEGHMRLMEALIGGALVMTDPMVHMPAGYVNSESIVVYNSLAEMVSKIKYYLSPEGSASRLRIAREGRRLALEHHKPKDVYNRLIFGKWPANNNNARAAVIDLLS